MPVILTNSTESVLSPKKLAFCLNRLLRLLSHLLLEAAEIWILIPIAEELEGLWDSMAFAGTQQKCKACDKTVYLVDQLVADNVVYHRACFRCHHCNGTLKLSNYASLEGVLYCRPHFDQLLKMTGSFDKSFETGLAPKSASKLHDSDTSKAPSKLSSVFSGTQEKCFTCERTVYPIEKVSVDGHSYHKACFKCSHGGCVISPSNYQAHDGRLYCRHHYTQLVKEKGNFSNLAKSAPVVNSGSKAEP